MRRPLECLGNTWMLFESILAKLELDLKHELLVLYKSDLFFISIERLLQSLSILPIKQQRKVLVGIEKHKANKLGFINLLHDLAIPILSIRV